MVARHYYRNDAGTVAELTSVPREGWETREGAEEGQSESSTIYVADTSLALEFVPHRRYIIYEDEAETANKIIFSGFVTAIDEARKGGDLYEPIKRVHTLTLNDMNTLFDNRVMVGGTDRPEESDVERITWVAESEEMGYFDSLTYLSSANAVTLDARDVAGQTPRQLFDEAAQDSDKNYWIGATGTAVGSYEEFLWYGKPTLSAYASPLTLLSNDPSDWSDAALLDGTSTVWPISDDTNFHKTGERIYSGVLVEYEGGRKYRKRTSTMTYFTLSGRDLVHPAPEIKTAARAARRADKLLLRLDEPDKTVKTTVRLPAKKATTLRAGMSVPFKATHLNGFETAVVCRILNATHRPVSAGRFYDITMELEPIRALGSCSTVLGSIDTSVSANGNPYAGGGAVSLTSPTGGLVIQAAIATNSNTPSDSALHFTDSSTELVSGSVPSNHPTGAVAYKNTNTTITGTYTPGYSPADASSWAVIAIGIDTATTSPVQSATVTHGTTPVTVGFASPASSGNMIVMALLTRGISSPLTGTSLADDSFTLLAYATAGSGASTDTVAIYAKCAGSSESNAYGVTVSKETIVSISEWSL